MAENLSKPGHILSIFLIFWAWFVCAVLVIKLGRPAYCNVAVGLACLL